MKATSPWLQNTCHVLPCQLCSYLYHNSAEKQWDNTLSILISAFRVQRERALKCDHKARGWHVIELNNGQHLTTVVDLIFQAKQWRNRPLRCMPEHDTTVKSKEWKQNIINCQKMKLNAQNVKLNLRKLYHWIWITRNWILIAVIFLFINHRKLCISLNLPTSWCYLLIA